MQNKINAQNIFVAKTEVKKQFGRTRFGDDIKIDHEEMGQMGADQVDLDQEREVTSSCEQDTKLSGSLKCGEFLENVNIVFLRRIIFYEIN